MTEPAKHYLEQGGRVACGNRPKTTYGRGALLNEDVTCKACLRILARRAAPKRGKPGIAHFGSFR